MKINIKDVEVKTKVEKGDVIIAEHRSFGRRLFLVSEHGSDFVLTDLQNFYTYSDIRKNANNNPIAYLTGSGEKVIKIIDKNNLELKEI